MSADRKPGIGAREGSSRDAQTRYWRSLDELILRAGGGAPETSDEFPPGASELAEGIDRRSLVKLLGASAGLAGLAGCRRPVEHIVPFVRAPEEMVAGIARTFATTMPFGQDALGLVVQSRDGRPTKIEGNELHPSSRGATNAWAQASILDLYDPDRSQSVLANGAASNWESFVAAWGELEPSFREAQGDGLAVLVGSYASPTLARLKRDFLARYPRARWVCWEPISDENVELGLERALGAAYRPLYRYDAAQVVVALDADLLLTESDAVAAARGFAQARRLRETAPEVARLYAVEGAHSLTGANADHRLRIESGRIGAVVAALAAALARRGLAVDVPAGAPTVEELDAHWLEVLAQDLLEHRGDSILVAGRRQPPAVHAAVFALNGALGNLGRTVVLHPTRDTEGARTEGLVELASAMAAGAVKSLVILGGNPVYNAPVDLDFASALTAVETSIHLGHHVDETARLAEWHVPAAHFLEAWGDARALDGTASVIQPLIRPLYAGKSDVEVLGLLASGLDSSGYDLVRLTWAELLGAPLEAPAFVAAWERTLHDGLLAGSALAAAQAAASASLPSELVAALPPPVSARDLELVFRASPALYDGRFANNGWLQELPDSLTKLTWDNAALLSPHTAAELGLADEDVVRLSYGDRQLELPVWRVPGMADFVVCIDLGYGRSFGGRIADGVGQSGYSLRTASAQNWGRGLTLERMDRRHPLAQTQDHHGMAGRAVVREATLERYLADPTFARDAVDKPHEQSLWKEWSYDSGYQWGMAIDLGACIGCNACVIACQSENNIPIVGKEQVRRGREMHWLRVDRYFSDEAEGVSDELPSEPHTVFQPVPCMHCENAPCEQVCPVAATVHDAEGINVMVYNRCIGTRYCSNNCPYKVRRFNFFNYTKHTPPVLELAANPEVTVRSRGVMEKCSYCTQRLTHAKAEAKREDRLVADGEARTACQQACPAQAITFGNLLDPESAVAAAKAEPRNYALLDELHTKPRTTYLARVRNPHPELSPSQPDSTDPAHVDNAVQVDSAAHADTAVHDSGGHG